VCENLSWRQNTSNSGVSILCMCFCHALLCISTAYVIVQCSVSLSVCHVRGLCQNKKNISSAFFHQQVATLFPFFLYQTLWQWLTGRRMQMGRQKSWLSTSIWLSDRWLLDCEQQLWWSTMQFTTHTDGGASMNLVYHSLQHGWPRWREDNII